jgi:two-component system, NtrC family, response regulator PilR
MIVNPDTAEKSNNKKPMVLIVDDQFRSFRSLLRLISPEAFHTFWVPDDRQGLKVLEDHGADVGIVIIDLKSSEMGGGGFFQHARHLAPHAAILITGPLGPFLYQRGNFYECFGFGLRHHINEVLSTIAHKMENKREPEKDKKNYERKECFGTIIGKSEGINEIYRLIDKLKMSSSTVLIQGESGTGKELIAQTVHQTSRRKNRPFVAINCGAIPSNLIESELFGHERGAFTTAINQRKGKFEVAEGGTLFLDEISELDRQLQVKLLRVLQEKEYQRVGGNRIHRTDVRIIAATSRDLKQAVKSKYFRDDLFFRLNVVPVQIPPLRERKEDIPLLLSHFFKKLAGQMERPQPVLKKAAEKALCDYDYPGNVRELINVVERLMVTCPNGHIAFNDLPAEICSPLSGTQEHLSLLNEIPSGGVRLNEMEKELILKTLEMAGGNKTEAARMLGITRRRLYLRLSTYGCS